MKRFASICCIFILPLFFASILYSIPTNTGLNVKSDIVKKLPKKWTILVYLAADNNLNDAGNEDLFVEMQAIGSSATVNVVVQIDNEENNSPPYARRYYVNPGSVTLIQNMDEIDMGDPQTLANFGIWGISNYPADHYLLILWDHGSGWHKRLRRYPLKGVCWDDESGNNIGVSNGELSNALQQIASHLGRKIDIVGFDACLMGMAEVAYECKDYADIMVGSEETEPGDGWPYDDILDVLVNTYGGNMTPAQLATTIVNKYRDSYDGGSQGDDVGTLSALNLGTPFTTFVAKIDTFAFELINNQTTYAREIAVAREQAQQYYEPTHIDLHHFTTMIKDSTTGPLQNTAAALLSAIDDVVIANGYVGSDLQNSYGIAIYYPIEATDYNTNYDLLGFAQVTLWDNFIKMGLPGVADITASPDTLRFFVSISKFTGMLSHKYSNSNCPKSTKDRIVLPYKVKSLSIPKIGHKGETDTLSHTFEEPIGFYSEELQVEYEATKLIPWQPCTLKTILVAFYNYEDSPKSKLCNFYVWNDNNGLPGTVLFSTTQSVSLGAFEDTWLAIDVSSANLTFEEQQPFWIGHYESVEGAPTSLVDAIATPQTTYWSLDGTTWEEDLYDHLQMAIVTYYGIPAPRDTAVMKVYNSGVARTLSVSNITSTLPWIISIEPTSFSVGPGNYQNVTVIVSSAGLSEGTYSGSLSISSNDRDESLYVEPVVFIIGVGEFYGIGGNLSYYSNDTYISDALILLTDGVIDSTHSDLTGYYLFPNLTAGLDYTVRPIKEDDDRGAITPFDASYVLRFYAGTLDLNPYQRIAADVTGNGEITPFDASYILRYYVGLIDSLPVGKDWAFVPTDFPIDTMNWVNAPDTIFYPLLSSNQLDEHYKGILYGDPTGNWGSASFTMKEKQGIISMIDTKDIFDITGNLINLPIKVRDASNLYSVGLTLKYDAKLLELVEISKTELTKDYLVVYNAKAGELRIAIAGSKSIDGSNAILEVQFRLADDANDTNTKITITDVKFNEKTSAKKKVVQLMISKQSPTTFVAHQNCPNPFNLLTAIRYLLPKLADYPYGLVVGLKIYDLTGRLVRTLVDELQKPGCYKVKWDGRNNQGEIVPSGIYYYRIEAGELKQVKSMLFIR